MKIKLPNFGLTKTFSIVALALGVMASLTFAAPTPVNNDAALKQQVAELEAKIKRLEAALPSKAASPAMPAMNQEMPASPAMPGMTPGSSDAMGMGEMKTSGMPKEPAGSAPMPGGGMGGMMTGMMGMMNQMMGMNAMPAASPGMASSVPPSALPGFPGVSHLYHIGSTGFFLDHAEHISLTSDQRVALGSLRQKALAAKTDSDNQIAKAEEEMATLTSADQPDSQKIEAKVREIEKLRVDQRLAFIRAVGEGAKLLTDDQRKILTGAIQAAVPAASATMSPMPDM